MLLKNFKKPAVSDRERPGNAATAIPKTFFIVVFVFDTLQKHLKQRRHKRNEAITAAMFFFRGNQHLYLINRFS